MAKAGDLSAAWSDRTLATRVVEALSNHTDPIEPSFLPAYIPEYHEPPLGELSTSLRHLYLLSVRATNELSHFTQSSLLRRRARLARQLFCQEVREEFKLEVGCDRQFEVCKGFRLCLVAEEVTNNDAGDFAIRFAPNQPPVRFVEDMMTR